jgi:hypothetical protein
MILKLNKIHLIYFVILAFWAGQSFAFGDPMVENTWREGKVFSPGKFFPETTKNFQSDNRFPVVLYFHGCSGISDVNDIPWAKLLSSNGYLVIMPDSFARLNKKVECDSRKYTKPSGLDGWLRIDEVIFSLKKVTELGWSNGTIYLMGHSQGAWALSRLSVEGVSGVVLSSLASCEIGINISKSIRVLRIGYSNDPWNKISPTVCDSHMIHENLEMNIIEGMEHETYKSNQFRKNVLDFFNFTKN